MIVTITDSVELKIEINPITVCVDGGGVNPDIAFSDTDIAFSDTDPLVVRWCSHLVNPVLIEVLNNDVEIVSNNYLDVGVSTATISGNDVVVSIPKIVSVDITNLVLIPNEAVVTGSANHPDAGVVLTGEILNPIILHNCLYIDSGVVLNGTVNDPVVDEGITRIMSACTKMRMTSLPPQIYIKGIHSPNLSFNEEEGMTEIIRVINNEAQA